METVLGLSMTANSIAWVLLDGTGADAETLDHDHFDVVSDATIDGDIAKHEAAVRGAQAIAAASGHQVKTIALTWSDDVDAKAALLLKSLPDMGFETVVAVPLPEATRSWAQTYHRTLGFERCALCVVESAAVTVVSVLYDTVRTARTQMRESADGLGRWLTEVFESNRAQPESLYVIGPRGDLELIAGPLDDALSVPVIASDEAQLTLARGAALKVGAASEPADEYAAASPAAARPARARRPRFGSHARAATVLVAGVVALFAVGPELAGLSDSATPENRPAVDSSDASAASNSSTTSMSVHAIPSPVAAPVIPAPQPLAAEPVPAPAPPEAEPTVAPAVAPAIPVQTAAEPVVAAVAEPQEAAQEPVEVPAQTIQETIEAEPAVAPAAPVVAQPVAAPPAPPALQAPPVPPAIAAPPAHPVPPPDPIAAALSPLFGGLP